MVAFNVANTIVEQLGGRKFIAMTGARRFVGSEDGLTFRLPGAGGFTKHSINCVAITLDPSDTYTIRFSRIHGVNIKVITAHHGIYCDALRELFTRATGLEVSL